MSNIQFWVTLSAAFITVATALIMFLYESYRKKKDRLIELNCKLYLSENIDELLDFYKKQTGVDISGILGNDFMMRNSYIIDYENLVVKHKTVKMSIKDSMEILDMPLIVLWQNMRKYIFLLDTGSTESLIHSERTKSLKCDEYYDDTVSIRGFGGSGESAKYIRTSLYYNKTK